MQVLRERSPISRILGQRCLASAVNLGEALPNRPRFSFPRRLLGCDRMKKVATKIPRILIRAPNRPENVWHAIVVGGTRTGTVPVIRNGVDALVSHDCPFRTRGT